MAGLVPAIHVLPRGKDVDAGHEAGHDGAIGNFAEQTQRQIPNDFIT